MKFIESWLEPGVNHTSGRTVPPLGVVIHVTEGSAASVVDWFHTPNRDLPSSANDMVKKDGDVVRFVRWSDIAWAQGRVSGATAKIVLAHPGKNPNQYLLSIEHEGDGLHDLTPEQFASSVELIRMASAEFRFPINRDTIIGHHEIFAPKTCPGKINVDALVAAAAGATSPVPSVVYSPYLGDYLIVTGYRSDTDWSFVPFKSITSLKPTPSTTSLARMPKHP